MTELAHADDRAASRDAKRADERDRLYRAGWVVLRRNGYANAGINDILAEAKLGTRAFYRHFASKDELLVSMFAENAAATASRLAERVDAAGSPLDRLRAWIDEILALGDDPKHGEAARMFISPTMPGVFDEAGNEAIETMRAPCALRSPTERRRATSPTAIPMPTRRPSTPSCGGCSPTPSTAGPR